MVLRVEVQAGGGLAPGALAIPDLLGPKGIDKSKPAQPLGHLQVLACLFLGSFKNKGFLGPIALLSTDIAIFPPGYFKVCNTTSVNVDTRQSYGYFKLFLFVP